jgi:hypothetical protein
MNPKQLSTLLFKARFALTRFGWCNSAACALLLAGSTCWLWLIPNLNARLEAQQTELERVVRLFHTTSQSAPVIEQPLVERSLANFYAVLGNTHDVEQQLKVLFETAKETGLSLSQAEYKAAFDKNGRFHTYQIRLPVKGGYGSIRVFCEQVLIRVPFMSLDEISFKRDEIAASTVEAKLRLTLYLNHTADLAPAENDSSAEADKS